MKNLIKPSVSLRADMNSDQNSNSNLQRFSSMPFVRYFVSYYRQNVRFFGSNENSTRYSSVVSRYEGFNLFDRRRFLSSNNQNDGVETRDIDSSQTKGSETPVQPSGGKLPFSNWAKWGIGSLFTLLLPFLYTQWKTLLKIGGKIETAKEAIEKTAEAVEKVAEMTEKVSKEAEEEFPDNEKVKKIADAVQHVSEIVEEEANLVDDVIHKVDEIEEDVKTMIDPISDHSKHGDENKNN
ncbi:hypothetical protein LUZ60_005723 [Juncus effusus]|nr:hypothetical protein LUZ60_005723 [Juncus effusus]